ncbi:glycosyl transferase family 2 [Coriobacterium glomerans PW2]|uniref:Glycosyl transferase family 2 n=1 Tax=Coriobacterium glomerans (strain ATCC 49209 / DSM 20642 / JCM 10262 / PW2) TaxID=700015 RepID=F2N721_CORGP|nr:glycosyltransferase family 2 protein [Coriobacterium glomerans]AEB06360.1 glycosyl transferase family 2 [Coriobacterium glomerans PW2]
MSDERARIGGGDADTLYIVMPAYNEQANIIKVLDQWYPVVERIGGESRLVVIDDGSRDETFRITQRFAETHPRLIAKTKPNSGHGATLVDAYRFALEHKATWVFQTDSDGQTDPAEFWQLWEARQLCDMAIGWRRGREDGLARVIVTKTLRAVVRMRFGVSLQDANTPFRLMSAQTLRENLKLVPAGFNLANVLLAVIYAKRGQRIRYFPITFKPRRGGVNSINMRSIIQIGYRALSDFASLNRELNERIERR